MAALELSGVTKRFGAIEALSPAIRSGEVVGWMGDNGAGKSPLVRIAAGNFNPSAGEIRMDARALHFHTRWTRGRGIEIVHSRRKRFSRPRTEGSRCSATGPPTSGRRGSMPT